MEEKSEKTRRILEGRPHWLLRRGISVLFAVFMVLIALVLCMDYPYGGGESIFEHIIRAHGW